MMNIIQCSNTLHLSFSPVMDFEEHQRIDLFYEKWIEKYVDTDFFRLFRMTRETCDILETEVGKIWVHSQSHARGRPEVPMKKSILILLWYLGKGETMISIADRFNLSTSTVKTTTATFISLIVSLRTKYIVWPKRSECATISEQFQRASRYPGVVGAIDGCHINCKVPLNQQDSYMNRKLNHSIILQGICTYNKVLTDICVGHPGSIHDALVLRESALGRLIQIQGYENYFYSKDHHLIGDSAYPLFVWLMKPYRKTVRLTRAQKNHHALSSGRVCIENVFGLLKGRWRILQYVNVKNIETVVNIVTCCCVLHNFCIINKDIFDMASKIAPEELLEYEQAQNGSWL